MEKTGGKYIDSVINNDSSPPVPENEWLPQDPSKGFLSSSFISLAVRRWRVNHQLLSWAGLRSILPLSVLFLRQNHACVRCEFDPPPLPPSRARTSAGPGIQAGREEEGADLFLFRTNGGTEDIHDYFFFGGGRGTQQKCFTQSFHQWGWSEMLFWVPYLSRGITQRMRNSGSNICTAQPYRAEEALTSPVGWHHSLLLLLLRRPPPPKTFRPFRLFPCGCTTVRTTNRTADDLAPLETAL